MNAWQMCIILVLASIVGYRLLRDVPPMLHTPLMSGMNALSGITVLGALTALGSAVATGSRIASVTAVILATVNVVGGFVVTHRMLRMFDKES